MVHSTSDNRADAREIPPFAWRTAPVGMTPSEWQPAAV